MLYLARRCDPDVEQLRKTLGLDPEYFLALAALGASYAQKGQMSQSIPELEKGTSLAECNQSLGNSDVLMPSQGSVTTLGRSRTGSLENGNAAISALTTLLHPTVTRG
jgi:hypothetical protein